MFLWMHLWCFQVTVHLLWYTNLLIVIVGGVQFETCHKRVQQNPETAYRALYGFVTKSPLSLSITLTEVR
jgi:hypothetical protein